MKARIKTMNVKTGSISLHKLDTAGSFFYMMLSTDIGFFKYVPPSNMSRWLELWRRVRSDIHANDRLHFSKFKKR